MATAKPTPVSASDTGPPVLWVSRALESLWLLTVVLVPLAAVGRDYMISEAVIAFAEVPKIAVLRTLVGLMAALWALEWALGGRWPSLSLVTSEDSYLRPSRWWPRLVRWLRERPTRWLALAVVFYLATTLISTALSASFSVSMWGEVPGQDSNAAYTVIAYMLLFAVVATHLRTRSQLWRLVGAIVAMGVLVGGYGALQHYGYDFFNLGEPTGGGTNRVTITMGNAVFSAAVLMLTIPISLMAATIHLGHAVRHTRLWLKLGLWVPALGIQLMGIIFTFSRGSWLGTMLALAIFLLAALALAGWRPWARATLVLGLAAGLVALLVVSPAGIKARAPGGQAPVAAEERIGERVVERLASVSEATAGGDRSLASRVEFWEGSWRLMLHHPWFQFDALKLSFLRPLIGYGPDLFRYTYLLESRPQPGNLTPTEADQPHNYFLLHGVEQGFPGLLSSLGLFVAVFLAGGYQLLRKRRSYSAPHILVLLGLLATLAGRFLEQMVGLARISDLTVFWVLLAMWFALPRTMEPGEVLSGAPSLQPPRRRRGGTRARPVTGRPGWDSQTLWRLAVVAWLVGGIVALTWLKTIRYPLAAREVGEWNRLATRGHLQASLAAVDRAIALAPDVSPYHDRRAAVFAAYTAYRDDPRVAREEGCSLREKAEQLPYQACLSQQAYLSNLRGAEQRPFYFRSRLALADSTLSLAKLQEDKELAVQAIRRYREVLDLVPYSWGLRNQAARAHIQVGQPEAALPLLEDSLAVTGETVYSVGAYFLKGVAYRDLGQPERAAQFLERGLQLVAPGVAARRAHGLLAETYDNLGQADLAEKHRNLAQEATQP